MTPHPISTCTTASTADGLPVSSRTRLAREAWTGMRPRRQGVSGQFREYLDWVPPEWALVRQHLEAARVDDVRTPFESRSRLNRKVRVRRSRLPRGREPRYRPH